MFICFWKIILVKDIYFRTVIPCTTLCIKNAFEKKGFSRSYYAWTGPCFRKFLRNIHVFKMMYICGYVYGKHESRAILAGRGRKGHLARERRSPLHSLVLSSYTTRNAFFIPLPRCSLFVLVAFFLVLKIMF